MANQANVVEINEGQTKIFTVSAANYIGSKTKPATADKNQLMPIVIPTIEGGQLPETARILPGTIAQRAGIEAGKSYQLSVTNGGPRPYVDKQTGEEKVGTQWNYLVLHTLSFKDLRDIQNEQSNSSAVKAPTNNVVANPFQ